MALELLNRYRNTSILNKLEPGDLIEFPRGKFSHWAVYYGNGKVIHLSGLGNEGLTGKLKEAKVRIDDFWGVVHDCVARRRNDTDRLWKPSPPSTILERAKSLKGKTKYTLVTAYCIDFAMWCRYGILRSDQIVIPEKLGRENMAKSQPNYEYNLRVLEELTPGDLIEFSRGLYSHWGIYMGNGKVIHVIGLGNQGKSAAPIQSAEVLEEDFWDITAGCEARKNNDNDGVWTPLPPTEILERAKSQLGRINYNLFTNNCEHFANWCRYDIHQSDQVQRAAYALEDHSILENVAIAARLFFSSPSSSSSSASPEIKAYCCR